MLFESFERRKSSMVGSHSIFVFNCSEDRYADSIKNIDNYRYGDLKQ